MTLTHYLFFIYAQILIGKCEMMSLFVVFQQAGPFVDTSERFSQRTEKRRNTISLKYSFLKSKSYLLVFLNRFMILPLRESVTIRRHIASQKKASAAWEGRRQLVTPVYTMDVHQ
jgi:hypothetical protein